MAATVRRVGRTCTACETGHYAYPVALLHVFTLVLISIIMRGVTGDMCDWAPDPNAQPNAYPIDTAPPVGPLRSVPNGKAYLAGQPGFQFWVTHLYGTDYEMGRAQGELFKSEVAAMFDSMWAWLEDQFADDLHLPDTWPQWFRDAVVGLGLDVALDALADADAPFIGKHIHDELQGLADGSGVDVSLLRRTHLIAELTQGQCSLIGAWGNATAEGKTIFGRAFDWVSGCPCKSWPALTVYHPSITGHAWANVGFIGWIGSFTAFGSERVASAMIGVEFEDSAFGNESFVGVPFVYLLRDIAQLESSYTSALTRISTANRTCDLVVGVADGNAGAYRGIQYSASVANVYSDVDQLPVNETWHPRLQNVVYNAMDWLCPQFDTVAATALTNVHGRIDAPNMIKNVFPIVQTGNIHAAVFDMTDNVMYVSFMRPANASSSLPENGYDRQYTRFNATELFAEPLLHV